MLANGSDWSSFVRTTSQGCGPMRGGVMFTFMGRASWTMLKLRFARKAPCDHTRAEGSQPDLQPIAAPFAIKKIHIDHRTMGLGRDQQRRGNFNARSQSLRGPHGQACLACRGAFC